jgi:activator of HSP90 ATPase
VKKILSPIEKPYFWSNAGFMDKLKLTVTLPAPPQEIYDAWLSTKEHTRFTGGKASASRKVNGKFTAWDGYITGKNVELKSGKKIVQAWRTTEFPVDAPDSILELTFEKRPGGKTKLTLRQKDIPKGQGKQYKTGWKEHYFEPMKEYFSSGA